MTTAAPVLTSRSFYFGFFFLIVIRFFFLFEYFLFSRRFSTLFGGRETRQDDGRRQPVAATDTLALFVVVGDCGSPLCTVSQWAYSATTMHAARQNTISTIIIIISYLLLFIILQLLVSLLLLLLIRVFLFTDATPWSTGVIEITANRNAWSTPGAC